MKDIIPHTINNSNKPYCNKSARCKDFRKCQECANIRQARISDVVELAARFSPVATYAVVLPKKEANRPEVIKALKTKLTRKLRQSTNGLMCSIETTPNDALHLNLIINSENKITPKPFQTIAKNLDIQADIFVQQIRVDEIRKVTAYALKKQSLPSREQYQGNILNVSGTVKTAGAVMQSVQMMKNNPLVAITAMNNRLIKMGLEPPSEALFKTSRLRNSLASLVYMTAQLESFEACWTEGRGLITADEFAKIYRKKIGTYKAELTRKKIDMQFDNRWRYLPEGVSLRQVLEQEEIK